MQYSNLIILTVVATGLALPSDTSNGIDVQLHKRIYGDAYGTLVRRSGGPRPADNIGGSASGHRPADTINSPPSTPRAGSPGPAPLPPQSGPPQPPLRAEPGHTQGPRAARGARLSGLVDAAERRYGPAIADTRKCVRNALGVCAMGLGSAAIATAGFDVPGGRSTGVLSTVLAAGGMVSGAAALGMSPRVARNFAVAVPGDNVVRRSLMLNLGEDDAYSRFFH